MKLPCALIQIYFNAVFVVPGKFLSFTSDDMAVKVLSSVSSKKL